MTTTPHPTRPARPLPTAITPGIHFQHVTDDQGTKLLACLLCSANLVPFFVHRDDFRAHAETEESLFKAMYTKLLAHLYATHADRLLPVPSVAPATPLAVAVDKLADALEDISDPDLQSLLMTDPDPSLDAAANLHTAVFAVARRHSQPPARPE